MTFKVITLLPGLYTVATPIGNARDITLRALDVLASADVLAAEDTRTLRHLMDIHGIALNGRPLVPYHDHNGARSRPGLLAHIREGRSVAYASDAGTPLIADPGFDLVREAAAEGLHVSTAPGPSALTAALTLAGLPTDQVLFTGFLPNTASQRRKALQGLRDIPATLVFYESPRRVAAMLADAAEILGETRGACLCREVTKKFEQARRGSLGEVARSASEVPPKGEIVVVIGKGDKATVSDSDLAIEIEEALKSMSLRDAAQTVSEAHGLPRRRVYQLAMSLAKSEPDDHADEGEDDSKDAEQPSQPQE